MSSLLLVHFFFFFKDVIWKQKESQKTLKIAISRVEGRRAGQSTFTVVILFSSLPAIFLYLKIHRQ